MWTWAQTVQSDKVTYFSMYGSCTEFPTESNGISCELQGIKFAFKHGMWHLSAIFFWDIQIYNAHGKFCTDKKPV